MAGVPNNPIDDITECPICTEVLTDTRVLPCVHTFCLKCIEQYGRNNKPGDTMVCPYCKDPFRVPDGGLRNLRKHIFIEKLLDARPFLAESCGPQLRSCSMMCPNKKDRNCQAVATWYCVECKTCLCDRCKAVHNKKRSQRQQSQHRVLPMGCRKHPEKSLEFYCVSCKAPICIDCTTRDHVTHNCVTLADYTQNLERDFETLKSKLEKSEADRQTEHRRTVANSCPKHPGRHLEFYCTYCRREICVSCSTSEHKSHVCVTVADRAKLLAAENERLKAQLVQLCAQSCAGQTNWINDAVSKIIQSAHLSGTGGSCRVLCDDALMLLCRDCQKEMCIDCFVKALAEDPIRRFKSLQFLCVIAILAFFALVFSGRLSFRL